MAMYNAKFWKRQFKDDFIPSTHRVVEVFVGRLLPSFSTVASEAEEYTEKLWEEAMSQPYDPDGPDESEIAEMVQEAGVEHYLGLKGMEQGVLNCCAIFLYHLFEQHLMLFHRREMLTPFEQDDIALIKHGEFHRRLESSGVSAKGFKSWPLLEELRLLANAIKHGEGGSSRDLAEIAPELFIAPALKESGLYEYSGPGRIYTPLIGEELFVTEAKVREYSSAIEQFWNELAESLNGI